MPKSLLILLASTALMLLGCTPQPTYKTVGGTMLGTIAAGFLPLPVLFCAALLCQLITGFNYFFFQTKKQDNDSTVKPSDREEA